jgi:PAS domain-containing protein
MSNNMSNNKKNLPTAAPEPGFPSNAAKGSVPHSTEPKRAETRVDELRHLLHAVRGINKLVQRAHEPQEVLTEACNILVKTRGYALVWIGLAERVSKRVAPAAHAGQQVGYLDETSVSWDESPTGRGPTGTAMRTGRCWACQNTATDPRFAPWREAALARGLASVAAVPMVHGAHILGALTVYANRAEAFHAEEITLLNEMAGDVAFALQSMEYERERKQTEKELQWKTAFLEAQVNSSLDGILVVNNQGQKLLQNQRFVELWKLPPDIAAATDDRAQIEFVAQKARNPQRFMQQIIRLNSHPNETSRDEIELADGMVLDCYSSPVIGQDGTNYGRIWTFRDISRGKEL